MSKRPRSADIKKRQVQDSSNSITSLQQSTLDYFRTQSNGSASSASAFKKQRVDMSSRTDSQRAHSSADDAYSKKKGKAPAHATDSAAIVSTPVVRGRREPAKTLVIKAFKVKPKLPENFVNDTWNRLERAVRAVHESKPVPDSLEELYQACENLCHHKKADELYVKLRAVCDQYVRGELLKINDAADTSILKVVNDCWTNYCRQMILIRSIFLYLDRTYVLQTSGLRSLWDMGLDLFRERIMDDQYTVKAKTVKAILEEIERERNGEQIDRVLLRSLLRMFVELSIYFSGFDTAFKDHTAHYYLNESNKLINEMETGRGGGAAIARYLRHVENRLAQENERCNPGVGYLDVGSRKGLVAVVEDALIRKHAKVLIDRGFTELMEQERNSDLARMYSLFSRIGALDKLRMAFAGYIRRTGEKIVLDEKRDPTMVEDLLHFKSRLDTVLRKSFSKNDIFTHALKESFEGFINQRHNKPAELIAKYVDAKLRSGKGVTEEELETSLDRCMVLFRFIQGKDVFEAFYKKDLAKRLLLQKSTSADAEKSMLSKLKAECGPAFTSKLEGMFKDIEISKDYMTSFRESARFTSQLGPTELSVNVLTQGFWPTYAPMECIVPEELAHCQEVFKEFYMSKHNGRRLTWQNSLGTCIIKAAFKKGNKELNVSLFQALILLPFNASTTLTYADLASQTGLEKKELDRTLASLSLGKARILIKSPRTKEFLASDTFTFNADFEAPLYRIKINQIQMRETAEERDKTEERVFQDRQYAVDAAIVRIMKMRKTLTHITLMAEVMGQVGFPIKGSDLKKRIESLIDREYMERDAKDASVYNYLA